MAQYTNKSLIVVKLFISQKRSVQKYRRLFFQQATCINPKFKKIKKENIYRHKREVLKSLTPNAAGVGYRLLKKKVIIFLILFKGVQISFRRFKPEIRVGFSHQLLVIIDWSGNSPTEGNTFVGLSVGDILPSA